MKEMGFSGKEVSPEMEHIIVSGMFAGIFELITHEIPIEKARKCIEELNDFYTAGWLYIMNVPLPERMNK